MLNQQGPKSLSEVQRSMTIVRKYEDLSNRPAYQRSLKRWQKNRNIGKISHYNKFIEQNIEQNLIMKREAVSRGRVMRNNELIGMALSSVK